MSKNSCIAAITFAGLTPSTWLNACNYISYVSKAVSKIKALYGTVWAGVAAVLASWAGTKVADLGRGLYYGAMNNGVDYTFNLNPIKEPIGANWTIVR